MVPFPYSQLSDFGFLRKKVAFSSWCVFFMCVRTHLEASVCFLSAHMFFFMPFAFFYKASFSLLTSAPFFPSTRVKLQSSLSVLTPNFKENLLFVCLDVFLVVIFLPISFSI